MNEKLLSDISLKAYRETHDPAIVMFYTPPGFLDKFAELIVRECIRTINQNENISLNIGNFTDEKKQGIQLGLEFAITDIVDHFDIEE